MKKLFLTCCLSAVLLAFISVSFATEAELLAGKNYSVRILCLGNAGDYCTKNELKQDEFQFQDDGSFKITSLENDKSFLDSSDGSFDQTLSNFSAGYTVTIDNLLKKYEFAVSGFDLADNVILGQFNVKYFELTIIPPEYDQKGEAPAYFLGFRE